MSEQANVRSIDTLAHTKAAIAGFVHEANQALAEVELQGQRAIDWICVDQAAYWKAEIRRATDQVNQAMRNLEHCRTYKKVGDTTPACIEEKKALTRAKQRLARAEAKAEAVRQWTPVVQRQFRETCVRLVRFRDVTDVDCPKAMAQLDRMLQALDAYRSTSSPRGGSDGGTQAAAVTRQLDGAATPDPAPEADSAGSTTMNAGEAGA
jgi:hypothetical protein